MSRATIRMLSRAMDRAESIATEMLVGSGLTLIVAAIVTAVVQS